jgi:thioredoxin reductase
MDAGRKAAIEAYKERKTPRGIFVVRCAATGNAWVDSAMDLEAAKNRTWFVMRHGDAQLEPALREDYRAHGLDTFGFEVLEVLSDDVAQIALRDTLKEKKRHWIERLGARTLSPL